MDIEELAIAGVFLLTPKRFGDDRGWFSVTHNQAVYDQALGRQLNFLQDNHAFSANKGTLRGMHFQKPPFAQAKLVRCLRGEILDVVVDIRVGSPTYGQHVGARLSGENGTQIFVPRGFAHAYVTLTDDCEVEYKVDGPYTPDAEGGLLWSDPALGIDWVLPQDKISVNERDGGYPGLADMPVAFRYGETF